MDLSQEVAGTGNRVHLFEKGAEMAAMALGDLFVEAAGQVLEQPRRAHAKKPVDGPHGHVLPGVDEGPVPREDVEVVGVHQRPVEIEDHPAAHLEVYSP